MIDRKNPTPDIFFTGAINHITMKGPTVWTEVDGKICKLEGFPDVDSFLHHPQFYKKQWIVSCGKCGIELGERKSTQKAAIESATAYLRGFANAGQSIEKEIDIWCARNGLSPRWKEEEKSNEKLLEEIEELKSKLTTAEQQVHDLRSAAMAGDAY